MACFSYTQLGDVVQLKATYGFRSGPDDESNHKALGFESHRCWLPPDQGADILPADMVRLWELMTKNGTEFITSVI